MDNKVFKGICASSGSIKAQAFVIKDLTDLPALPDYEFVLIAPYTTPILNAYIANAKAIVCEMGGMTCHAAIVAREFGIPCVVNVKGILDYICAKQEVGVNIEPGEVVVYG